MKGSITIGGYLVVGLRKNKIAKTHNVHQLVAHEWVDNPEEKRCVDHIDGNKVNNHLENLRWATHAENSRNMKKHTDGSSVYNGVSLHKQSNKWVAKIQINGKPKHLGLFESEREAAEVYNAAAIEHYGEFAKLNKLD